MSESFYLPQLDVDVTSSEATLSGSVSQEFTGDATVNVNVTLSTFKQLFLYQTDSSDITDAIANDVKFRSVYSANNLPLGIDINSSAPVVVNPIDYVATNNNVTYDYLRYLAENLFNSHLGVDLFNNEETMRSSLNDNFKVNLNSVLVGLNNAGITDQSVTSPSKTIFNQLIANKPSRFQDITDSESATLVDGNKWYYMPCVVGDKFYFRLTVSAAEDQHKLTAPTSTTPIEPRTYLICANIIDDPAPAVAPTPTPTIFKYSSGIDVTSTQPTISSTSYLVNDRVNTDLVSVIVGTSCTSLALNCFLNCTNLTSVTIPDSVTTIGNACFRSCIGLTSMTIPNSVTSLTSSFYDCSGLTSVTLPTSLKIIGTSCFRSCSGLTSIVIPASVTSLGNTCFFSCIKLTSMTIPNMVTTIGTSCFETCSNLTSITIPNSVISIGSSCFRLCTGLTSIEIPNSVTSLGLNCFQGCEGLTSVTIPNSVTSLGISCFASCINLISVTIPNLLTSVGNNCFRFCSGLTSIIIPNSVTYLGGHCFEGCTVLTSIIIGNSVTSIGPLCFFDCSALTSITIPESVTSIGDICFGRCSTLTSVTFNNPDTIAVNITNMLLDIAVPITITFMNTVNYSELNEFVNIYFSVTPPANWSYVFIA